ncbi:MAG: hypothetical protein MI824_06300 [Hyphomicrobiales bacterium]|nr:hypothetical protein [Hyphomicrobiales bacterium]
MSGADDKAPRGARAAARRKAVLSACYWLAILCLAGLAGAEALGATHPWIRGALMVGIAIAGTGIIIMQAQRRCPNCGAAYGYYPRLINASRCRRCGAEFPSWPLFDEPEKK